MANSTPTIKTPLKRAKGYGSAHEGGHNWIMERVTSLALIPLVVWFVASIISLVGAEQIDVVEFFESPFNAVVMVLLIIISFYHTALGLVCVVEDYVHNKAKKIASIIFIKLGLFVLGLTSIAAVVKLSFFA